ncbi:ATP-binding protein [Streptomyces sp. ATCC51928]|uniref:AAA family ATPase n=1 Tax=Streptomyces caviscabies TaxID=90079 RepID=A0ABW2M9D9_9ACTN|nr:MULTISPECIES: ATP-binding protein [unclassified Streptomyces]MCL6286999.1 ATP-binding protein [Streptomyces sp. 43Y-GA-1]MDX3507026.1 ATP-binding protein [Streptomyces sp. ATCC51928]MDX5521871.1 ATP-binding protein [Streptomyces sp. DE06-01C]
MPNNSPDRADGGLRPDGHASAIRIPAGLVVLVGPPASGKTSFVRALVERGQIEAEAVVSSDEIRAELFGAAGGPEPADSDAADATDSDAADATDSDAADSDAADARIFEERDRRIVARLAAGRTVIAESTNVTPQARARLVALARRFDAPVTALRFAPDVADLLQQYAERGRTDLTPADVRAYAAVMSRDAGADRLRSEGAAAVHDVPGRRRSVRPAEAAARFVFGRVLPGYHLT